MVIIPERWERIVDLVESMGQASVDDIARALDVSAPTVRRDLARLQQRGLISRFHGGARPSARALPGFTITQSRRVNPKEKEAIGRAAAALVQLGSCVVIDGGFTAYQVARHIEVPDVKVITNSLDVAQVLATRRDVTLVMLGGEVLVESGTTVGPTAVAQLAELVADVAFLGANAISIEEGLCADMQLTAETKKAMIRTVREVVVVADHSKLGRSALHRVAPTQALNVLVTDDKADPSVLDSFRAAGVRVIVANTSEENDGQQADRPSL
ncbi:MAG: DeoR/GlpR family DNA-binding transcription regulator [Armatimonadetes bacterium]|nr:DeoR/GlpR family DNA-binding transcription regulator [Armatimonadota bacterium]